MGKTLAYKAINSLKKSGNRVKSMFKNKTDYADTSIGMAARPEGFKSNVRALNSTMGGSKRQLSSLSKDAAKAANKRSLNMGLKQHVKAVASRVAKDAAIKGQMRSISLRKTKRQDML